VHGPFAIQYQISSDIVQLAVELFAVTTMHISVCKSADGHWLLLVMLSSLQRLVKVNLWYTMKRYRSPQQEVTCMEHKHLVKSTWQNEICS
jgi:hypothetical protein